MKCNKFCGKRKKIAAAFPHNVLRSCLFQGHAISVSLSEGFIPKIPQVFTTQFL